MRRVIRIADPYPLHGSRINLLASDPRLPVTLAPAAHRLIRVTLNPMEPLLKAVRAGADSLPVSITQPYTPLTPVSVSASLTPRPLTFTTWFCGYRGIYGHVKAFMFL